MIMLGFNFIPGSNFIFLCFKLIIIYYKTQKQKKIKFEPRIKLNHNNYEPRAQIKQMFQEGELKQGIKRAIKEFSAKYIVSETLAADFNEHLTDIEMQKVSDEQKASGIQ